VSNATKDELRFNAQNFDADNHDDFIGDRK
jgi:hypothetical protein